jgi:hypothetical protein
MDNQSTKTEEQLAQEAEARAKALAEKEAAIEKSNKVPLLKKTKDNYVPAIGAENDYHARIEVKSFNPNDGKRQSKPQLQTFSPKGWKVFEANSANLGYSVDILHDPTGEYPKAGKEKAEFLAKMAKGKK